MKTHILCLGDSNTHGYCADPNDCADHGIRFNEEERWTCRRQKALGDEYLDVYKRQLLLGRPHRSRCHPLDDQHRVHGRHVHEPHLHHSRHEMCIRDSGGMAGCRHPQLLHHQDPHQPALRPEGSEDPRAAVAHQRGNCLLYTSQVIDFTHISYSLTASHFIMVKIFCYGAEPCQFI